MTLRRARPQDAQAIGLVVRDGLEDAPSALIQGDELGRDAERLGQHILRSAERTGQQVYIAEDQGLAVGVSRIIRREFARSSHVALLWLMVIPRLRDLGYGRQLIVQTTERAFDEADFERLEFAVACHDQPLRYLLEDLGWITERVERGALRDDDGFRDLLIYTCDRPLAGVSADGSAAEAAPQL